LPPTSRRHASSRSRPQQAFHPRNRLDGAAGAVRRSHPPFRRQVVRHRVHLVRRSALRRELGRVMAEAARVLRAGGRFVFSTTHPSGGRCPMIPAIRG
jgi:hypothetical protein